MFGCCWPLGLTSMGAIHGKGRFQCSGCHQGFSWRLDLANHLQHCKAASMRYILLKFIVFTTSIQISILFSNYLLIVLRVLEIFYCHSMMPSCYIRYIYSYFTGNLKTSMLSITCWRRASCVDNNSQGCTVKRRLLLRANRSSTTPSVHWLRCAKFFFVSE